MFSFNTSNGKHVLNMKWRKTYSLLVRMLSYSNSEENIMKMFQKRTELPYSPGIPLLGIFLQ